VLVWFQALGADVKSVVVAIIGSVAGAIVGAIIKGIFDRRLHRKLENLVEEASSERRAAMLEREDALQEREAALLQLHEREAENRDKQRRLDDLEWIIKAREIDVEGEKTKLDQLLATLRGNDTGLWMSHGKQPPFEDFNARIDRRKPVIIVIANNKGGVGKTTVAGNLLAYFDRHLRKRVLVIDLDYQGSISTMLRSEQGEAVQERRSFVNELLSPGASLGSLWAATRPLGERLSRSALAPAFYELALFEDRLLVEWLLQQGGDDVRYRLASVLLMDAIKDKYDVILIDVPPRMTTGTINALCASTHVLIPAIFNPLAAEPVENFLKTSKALMNELNPKLEFLGVLETMSPRANEGQDVRAEGRRVISEALQRFNPAITILANYVPLWTLFAEGVGYLKDGRDGREARRVFNALGDEIRRRVGL
jgi:cellulose biosynthesis protein BcsQ